MIGNFCKSPIIYLSEPLLNKLKWNFNFNDHSNYETIQIGEASFLTKVDIEDEDEYQQFELRCYLVGDMVPSSTDDFISSTSRYSSDFGITFGLGELADGDQWIYGDKNSLALEILGYNLVDETVAPNIENEVVSCTSENGSEDGIDYKESEDIQITKLLKINDGYIINDIVHLKADQWHTLIPTNDSVHYCVICDQYVNSEDRTEHIANKIHSINMDSFKPKKCYGYSIIKRIRSLFHCGVCNLRFTSKDFLDSEHTETESHVDSVLFALSKASAEIHKLSLFHHTPSENQKQQRCDVNSDTNYEDHESAKKANKYSKVTIYGMTEAARNYTDDAFEMKGEKSLHQLKQDLLNAYPDSWNMIIAIGSDKFYCMTCKEYGEKSLKDNHTQMKSHIENLNNCLVVYSYTTNLVRMIDDKLLHCFLCNNLQSADDMDSHMRITHSDLNKTKQKIDNNNEVVETVINIEETTNPESTCQKSVTNPASKVATYRVDNTPRYRRVDKTPPYHRVDNTPYQGNVNFFNTHTLNQYILPPMLQLPMYNMPNYILPLMVCRPQFGNNSNTNFDMNTLITTVQFGVRLTVTLLAYNAIVKNADWYFCILCDQNLEGGFCLEHMMTLQHSNFMQNVPFMSEFQVNLIRLIRMSFHCAICNKVLPYNKDYIKAHIVQFVHCVPLRNALCSELNVPVVSLQRHSTLYGYQNNDRNNNYTDVTINIDPKDEEYGMIPKILPSTLAVKLNDHYLKVDVYAWNSLVADGKGKFYCFVCAMTVNCGCVLMHFNDKLHLSNLDNYRLLVEYGTDLLRQINCYYHCVICNIVVMENNILCHLFWPQHVLRLRDTLTNVENIKGKKLSKIRIIDDEQSEQSDASQAEAKNLENPLNNDKQPNSIESINYVEENAEYNDGTAEDNNGYADVNNHNADENNTNANNDSYIADNDGRAEDNNGDADINNFSNTNNNDSNADDNGERADDSKSNYNNNYSNADNSTITEDNFSKADEYNLKANDNVSNTNDDRNADKNRGKAEDNSETDENNCNADNSRVDSNDSDAISSQKKVKVFIDEGVVRLIPWVNWNGFVPYRSSYKCLVCKLRLVKDNVSQHARSTSHVMNLYRDTENALKCELIRRVNENIIHCILCNKAMGSTNVVEHIKGKYHLLKRLALKI